VGRRTLACLYATLVSAFLALSASSGDLWARPEMLGMVVTPLVTPGLAPSFPAGGWPRLVVPSEVVVGVEREFAAEDSVAEGQRLLGGAWEVQIRFRAGKPRILKGLEVAGSLKMGSVRVGWSPTGPGREGHQARGLTRTSVPAGK
jgi:hypothetical protein